MKKKLKSLIPPVVLNIFINIKNQKYGWKGDYPTWQEAQKHAVGYNAGEILKAVRSSLLKVKNGKAIYERDSVVFDKIQYSWKLLAGLMFCSSKMGGALSVLDFGGSLGSTYYQNKKFLDRLDDVSWSIVEQKHFVDTGKEDFEDERLKFFYDVESCVAEERPNILLLSSVIQYIEKPFELLDTILEDSFDFILIDRTTFSIKNEKDIISVQKIRLKNYTSIPCWLFSERKFKSYFECKYFLLEEFDLLNEKTNEKYEKGMIWMKK
jgi:putative methyltransferase (TIGR04325 family)